MSGVGVLTALAAGLLSFLSPCVLPLIPAYLSLVSGYGIADIRSGTGDFLVGMAFAAGWSPCVGPILASILLYAARFIAAWLPFQGA